MNETNYEIFQEIDQIKSNYEGLSLEKVPGLTRSQWRVIKMCEYYSDSKYMGTYLGNTKMIGTAKIDIPFYNVVNYRVALAKTATDIDIKDIQVVSDNPDTQTESMILNREAYEWMKEAEFSRVLNEMGLTRPKYGGYLIKKNEVDGELDISVVKWTNVWTDQTRILSAPIAETHHMGPVELKSKDGTWSNVDVVLKAHRDVQDKQKSTTIQVIEITGELPKCIYNDSQGVEDSENDEYTFSLQHYFVASVGAKKYLMFAEELPGELTDYYEYLPWEDNGYGLGRGVIESSEEAQVWTNDSVINEYLAMNLAGRAGILTDSKKLGNNILEHDHGKVYKQDKGDTTTVFNLTPAALGQYETQMAKWKEQLDNDTGSVTAMTGNISAGSRNYSLQALMHQVAMKHFDYFRAEWGIHLTKIFDKWIIPYLIKKLNNEHLLVSEFSDAELEMIDEAFANYNTNNDLKKRMFSGQPVNPQMQQDLTTGYKNHIQKLGKKRFIEVPKGYFDDIECKVTVVTTDEQRDKTAILQSLNELLKTAEGSFNRQTGSYGVLDNEDLRKLYNQILELSNTGITPVKGGKPPVNPQVQPPPGAPTNVSPNPAAGAAGAAGGLKSLMSSMTH